MKTSLNPELVCYFAFNQDSSFTVVVYTADKPYILVWDPIVRENVPHGRAMNAIESCLKVYKGGKGWQFELKTFFNQDLKAEDLVCKTTPTPETPLVLADLPIYTFSHPVQDDMSKYFARNRQEGDTTLIAANGPIPFLKDGTNQILAPVLWTVLQAATVLVAMASEK